MINRREFGCLTAAGLTGLGLAGSGNAGSSTAGPSGRASVAQPLPAPATSRPAARKRIALLGTTVFQHSHAQHFLDRFAIGYAMGGEWREPAVELAGVYLDQFGDRDIGRERIDRYGLKLFPTVREALTLGGEQLAVDGVVIIAEHGDYPRNEKGQTCYPRYAWFKEAIRLFEECGRSVPVFNDKHLSVDWAECREMVEDSRRLGFPFLAGSSLPVTWRLPAWDLPFNADLAESVCVAYGGIDSYDFHALETAQCISERRKGGESGIASVHAVRDARVWEQLAAREATCRLFLSALSRSHSLPVQNGYPVARPDLEWARSVFPSITALFIEHLDGFLTTVFLTGIRDFNYAGRLAGTGELVGCQMMLPMPGQNSTTADFFNPLVSQVEQMVLQGMTHYPIERTLLTSGMVIGGVESLHAGETPFRTDGMAIAYQGPAQSMFWSA